MRLRERSGSTADLGAVFLGRQKGEACFTITALPECIKASLSRSHRHRNKAKRAQQQSGDPSNGEVKEGAGRSTMVVGCDDVVVRERNEVWVMMK